jgi:hypothetical protein
MNELGKVLVGFGAVIVVVGILLMLPGRTLGAAAGGFFISREEYYGVFSAGYFCGGECGAFDFVVFGGPVAAVRSRDGIGGAACCHVPHGLKPAISSCFLTQAWRPAPPSRSFASLRMTGVGAWETYLAFDVLKETP